MPPKKTAQVAPGAVIDKLPQSIESERVVLGAAMFDESCIDGIGPLTPEDFYRDAHRAIWGEILYLRSTNQPVDLTTVTQRLTDTGKLDAITGGALYVTRLLDVTMTTVRADWHGAVIRRKAKQRAAIVAAIDAVTALRSVKDDVELAKEVDQLQQALFESISPNGAAAPMTVRDVSVAEYDRLVSIWTRVRSGQKVRSGLSTGYADLDDVVGGLHPGELTIIAGRPATGKTTLLANMALRIGRDVGAPVAFFSAEMPREAVIQKWLAMLSGTSTKRMRGGELDPGELAKVALAHDMLADVPIWIDDASAPHVMDLRLRARRLVDRKGAQVIFVDYLQRIHAGHGRMDRREEMVGDVAEALKNLSRDLHVPVVAAAQLSRDIEKRGEHALPQLSDLRESGRIEQEADVVAFVYHDIHDLKQRTRLLIRKHRMGPETDVELRWRRAECRFDDA